jgi:signal transduction histidine kinase
VNLRDVVEDAAELVRSLFTQSGQTLAIAVPNDLPSLVGDAPRLTQVFVNLLANANKFGPEGSVVSVGARSDGETIEAYVEDAGPGVTELERGSIFERFHRAADQEPEPRGLGLGLWIVKSIVERHAGTVAWTRGDSGLSRFVVRLPLRGPVA